MAGETFVGNPDDIHMGPAALYYDSRCLGYTLNDSVKINISMTPTPITPDQSSLPTHDIVTEVQVSVDATLAEVNETNLNMIPGVANGVFSDPIGINMKALAKPLVIVPLDSSDNNKYTLPSACPSLADGISFVKNTPQGLVLNFKAYADSAGVFLKREDKA